MTPDRIAARLRSAGIDPDGHGERPGETIAEHAARVARELEAARPALLAACARIVAHDMQEPEEFDPLDYLPCQALGLEEIDI